MKNLFILLFSILFFSCQQKENKNTLTDITDSIVTTKNSDSTLTTKNKQVSTSENTKENRQTGDTIFMNFKNEKDLFVAEGSLDSIHSKIYVKFKNENSGELKAQIITTTGKGNIRFNQIIFPDKSSDGPFGMDLKIDLKQKGNYILVIGHSLMADNPYFGKFKVQLEKKE